MKSQLARWVALLSYFALFVWLCYWHTQYSPANRVAIYLLLQAGPLLFPLRGMLDGRRYTHVWASYLAMYYLLIGIDSLAAGQILRGSVETTLSVLWFVSCFVYVRFAPKPKG